MWRGECKRNERGIWGLVLKISVQMEESWCRLVFVGWDGLGWDGIRVGVKCPCALFECRFV